MSFFEASISCTSLALLRRYGRGQKDLMRFIQRRGKGIEETYGQKGETLLSTPFLTSLPERIKERREQAQKQQDKKSEN